MTQQKLLEIINQYYMFFRFMHIEPLQYPLDKDLPPDKALKDPAALKHCHWMLGRMTEFVKEGKVDKAFRWLGFIQGVLWSQRLQTIEQMSQHNRSITPPPGDGDGI